MVRLPDTGLMNQCQAIDELEAKGRDLIQLYRSAMPAIIKDSDEHAFSDLIRIFRLLDILQVDTGKYLKKVSDVVEARRQELAEVRDSWNS